MRKNVSPEWMGFVTQNSTIRNVQWETLPLSVGEGRLFTPSVSKKGGEEGRHPTSSFGLHILVHRTSTYIYMSKKVRTYSDKHVLTKCVVCSGATRSVKENSSS